MNVLIPMAGRGSRFLDAGYKNPKPLIDVDGVPMIELVINNIGQHHKYIFVVQKEHVEKFNLDKILTSKSPSCKIVIINEVTEGAACTALLASRYINNSEPLLIANSDQYLEWKDEKKFPTEFIDGNIVTFKSRDSNCSYVKEVDGKITECREKERISETATVGLYHWSKGSDFVKYANIMIDKNIRVNNEFYICPVYNEAIKDGKVIKSMPAKYVWQIGTPKDLNVFLDNKRNIDNGSWQDF